MSEWLLPLLRCPACAFPLTHRRVGAADAGGILGHEAGTCSERYPVIGGIPRLLVGPGRAEIVRAHRNWFAMNPETSGLAATWEGGAPNDPVIAGFDDEWQRFGVVGTSDQSDLFSRYFDLLPPERFAASETVLDAGCGAGRWAFEVSRRGPRVIAVDLGRSIEVARGNTPSDRVSCIQADITTLPLASGSVDWAYSLGVLHHTNEPTLGLEKIIGVVRAGGPVLLYLYYALDQRGPLFRSLFQAVDLTRRVVSQQPRSVARAVATAIAGTVYWPLARSAALLERAGLGEIASKLPLSFYRHLSFATMRNDSLDRFGTRLERRFSREEMVTLMERAGLREIVISARPPLWHGIGLKPSNRAGNAIPPLASPD
ncbi:MAG: methyltransferase domain-containing protein [Gaiellales bacterium]